MLPVARNEHEPPALTHRWQEQLPGLDADPHLCGRVAEHLQPDALAGRPIPALGQEPCLEGQPELDGRSKLRAGVADHGARHRNLVHTPDAHRVGRAVECGANQDGRAGSERLVPDSRLAPGGLDDRHGDPEGGQERVARVEREALGESQAVADGQVVAAGRAARRDEWMQG